MVGTNNVKPWYSLNNAYVYCWTRNATSGLGTPKHTSADIGLETEFLLLNLFETNRTVSMLSIAARTCMGVGCTCFNFSMGCWHCVACEVCIDGEVCGVHGWVWGDSPLILARLNVRQTVAPLSIVVVITTLSSLSRKWNCSGQSKLWIPACYSVCRWL